MGPGDKRNEGTDWKSEAKARKLQETLPSRAMEGTVDPTPARATRPYAPGTPVIFKFIFSHHDPTPRGGELKAFLGSRDRNIA